MKNLRKIVVAGVNVRNIAKSARTAGFRVYAVTKYCDEDLKIYSDKVFGFCRDLTDTANTDNSAINRGVEKVIELCQSKNIPAVLSTGFEKFFKEIQRKVDVIGSFDQKVVDKLYFYKKLEKTGIPHPEVLGKINNVAKKNQKLQDLLQNVGQNLEAICKPRIGGGGIGVFLFKHQGLRGLNSNLEILNRKEDKSKRCNKEKEYIIQKYLKGKTISAIVLRNESKSVCVSINENLSGWRVVNAKGFMYSGNITPYITSHTIIQETAKEVAELFEVIGCAGVDMIVNESGVYVLELNPRIPGSLDSFELSCDENLFSLHLAYSGFLVKTKSDVSVKPKRFACRVIYYSPTKLKARIPPTHPFYADIPAWNEEFEAGEPVTSIISTGDSRNRVVKLMVDRKRKLERVYLI